MADYPPYDPKSKCSKCGHDQVSSRYEPESTVLNFPDGVVRVPEHLGRTCDRCGYQWIEATLEHRPEPSAEEAAANALRALTGRTDPQK